MRGKPQIIFKILVFIFWLKVLAVCNTAFVLPSVELLHCYILLLFTEVYISLEFRQIQLRYAQSSTLILLVEWIAVRLGLSWTLESLMSWTCSGRIGNSSNWTCWGFFNFLGSSLSLWNRKRLLLTSQLFHQFLILYFTLLQFSEFNFESLN